MNNRLNKGISELKAVKMTASEKATVLHNVMAKIAPKKSFAGAESVPTPYFMSGFQMWMGQHRMIGTVMATILIVAVTGSSVAFASEKSLPGDALYAVKVSVTEPIRTALQTTPEAQASWQAHLAEARMDEAETLAAQGKLDADKQQEIETLLAKHTAAFEVAVNNTKDEPEQTTDASASENTQIADNAGGTTSTENTDNANSAPVAVMSMSVSSETNPTEPPVAAKASLSMRTMAVPTTMGFAAKPLTKAQRLRNDFGNKLRERAHDLEAIKHNADATTTVEVSGVVEAAIKNADAVEQGSSDKPSFRGIINMNTRSNRSGGESVSTTTSNSAWRSNSDKNDSNRYTFPRHNVSNNSAQASSTAQITIVATSSVDSNIVNVMVPVMDSTKTVIPPVIPNPEPPAIPGL